MDFQLIYVGSLLRPSRSSNLLGNPPVYALVLVTFAH